MIGLKATTNIAKGANARFAAASFWRRQLSTNSEVCRHAKNPQKIHNASPKLPLLYYKASNQAMKSINHRVFYANWIFVFAAYDFFSTFVDF